MRDAHHDVSKPSASDFFTLNGRMISTTPTFWYNTYSMMVHPFDDSQTCPHCTVSLTFPNALDIHYRECAGRAEWTGEILLLKRLATITRTVFNNNSTESQAKLLQELDLLSNAGGTAMATLMETSDTTVCPPHVETRSRSSSRATGKKPAEVETASTSRHQICAAVTGIVVATILGHLYTIKHRALN